MMRLILALLAVLGLVAEARPGAAQNSSFWEGHLALRGAQLGIRLAFGGPTDSAATLDIPDLLMAGEPVPSRVAPDGATVTLPFGLGEVQLVRRGDSLTGIKAIGTDTLHVRLALGHAPPLRHRVVWFESDGDSLHGELTWLTDRAGGRPGVVLLHGSGRQGLDRWAYRSWADLLAREGFVVLAYDKRGVARSGGRYPADLDQLARDGALALAALRHQPEVDSGRVGLLGWSQGFWLGEAIAGRNDAVAFLVGISGAAVAPWQQDLQQLEYGMRADGRPEDQIHHALTYAGLYFYVARTGHGWGVLDSAVRAAKLAPWGEYVSHPETPKDLAWWRRNHVFPPRALLDAISAPILALYGGNDWITPPAANVGPLRELFAGRNLEVHVFPGADHRLEVPAGRDASGQWHWPRIAPGALDTVRVWLRGITRPD